MKKIILVLWLLGSVLSSPLQIGAASSQKLPCSLLLSSVNNDLGNAKGVALVYKVKRTPSFPRTNISILGVHLPEPSSFGDYDGYEGFAFVPDVISWEFKLYPTTEENGAIWAGRIDDITLGLEKATIQVRPSNSKTDKLGPEVLSGNFEDCQQ